ALTWVTDLAILIMTAALDRKNLRRGDGLRPVPHRVLAGVSVECAHSRGLELFALEARVRYRGHSPNSSASGMNGPACPSALINQPARGSLGMVNSAAVSRAFTSSSDQ